MNIYDFTVKAQDGSDVNLSTFEGKTLLVVNTATGCGFTPQYEELQKIYEELHESGLEILDFPCNQFGNQAPGEDEEIHDFCTGRYGITFEQYSKIDVNGENASPLYKWITANTKFAGFNGPMKLVLAPIVKKMDPDYKNNGNIKWNFTKILVNKKGEIVERFEPTASLDEMKARIKEVL
ncbi:MAG: glutathione peroxidase [Lachnospiraceae bacterium]|nr:glutathione peroxidase [Lachnospiraceae bacterium]